MPGLLGPPLGSGGMGFVDYLRMMLGWLSADAGREEHEPGMTIQQTFGGMTVLPQPAAGMTIQQAFGGMTMEGD